MNDSFSLAPLQGITDYTFRNLISKHFGGIDKVYTPFLRLQNDKTFKKSQITDVLPKNNAVSNLIPQILCNTADDLIYLANYLADFGYEEVNWNLGCPYPMVAKRQMGSGLLQFPERIDKILDKSLPFVKTKISIKLRSGYENEDEILKLIPVINRYQISELIIHPRIGKQIYKGDANPDVVEKCLKAYNGKVAYNGDIVDKETFDALKRKFIKISHWMIGRALIANPFLVEEIIYDKQIDPVIKLERFSEFHYELYEFYKKSLSGPGHLLSKMSQLWEYFSKAFSKSHRIYKSIKKAKSLEKLDNVLFEIFNSEQII